MSLKILVVDNDADVRRLLYIRLARAQYQVQGASNAEAALEYAASEQPDIVISEVRLPGMDGFALANRFKSSSNPPLVILLTALASYEDISAGFAAGADDYLTKPFSPLVLAERVRVNLIRTGRAVSQATAASGREEFDG